MPDNLSLGPVCVIVGIGLTLLAWTFFRKEEYKFFTFAPFNEAHKYMRPPGGAIWWIGMVILCVGIFKTWAVP